MSEPMVVFDRVSKSYGALEVLKEINLEVAPGEVLSLIGPSGSGKSTLLRCVNHLERIDGGSITVDGELIGYRQVGNLAYELPEKLIAKQRARIAMVFQNFNLFGHMTVLENVIEAPVQVLGVPKAHAIDHAKGILDQVGLADKLETYPRMLSGGQQQRVAIARAGAPLPMEAARDATHANIMEPVFTGERATIEAEAEKLNWDISQFQLIEAEGEKDSAMAAAMACGQGRAWRQRADRERQLGRQRGDPGARRRCDGRDGSSTFCWRPA